MAGKPTAKGKCPIDVSIATSPNDIKKLPGLLKDITEGINAIVSGSSVDRDDLLIKSRSLVRALETPRQTMVNHCWAEIGAISAITFGIDCGLWALMIQNGDKPQNVADLASTLGVETSLLSRLMRHLAAVGFLKETGEGSYCTTNFIKALTIPVIGHGYLALIPGTSAAPLRLHEFCRKRGWKNPSDSNDTPLMYAYGTDKNVFAWLRELNHDAHLNDYLGGYNLGRLSWMDPAVYPVNERLIVGGNSDEKAPFLVDIGGNIGHDMNKFKRLYPNHPGELILQDLPEVVAQIEHLDPSIRIMSHDFLTEQPIKGARAYLIHSCLHNWPDNVCHTILSRIRDAMRPGYSKLLICELVIPETGAYWEDTALDMMVMSLCASEERTRKAWHALLEDTVGLRILKIWPSGKGMESLIECDLA